MAKSVLLGAYSALLLCLVAGTAPLHAQCLLCLPNGKIPPGQTKKLPLPPLIPITIETQTSLDFSRATLGRAGKGSIRVTPDGQKIVSGDLSDLGGMALVGSVTIRGEPGRSVVIDIPASVTLSGSYGGVGKVDNIETDLSPDPHLNFMGELRFNFGGTFSVTGGRTGVFRGRIPVTADYQ